jgi:hypothetical protein
VTTCPRCATPREGSYRMCPSCGFDYWKDAAATTCPRCQVPRSGSMPICPSCGYDYRNAEGPAAEVPASQPGRRGSRLPFVLITLVFLAVVAGAVGLFYSQVQSAQHATDTQTTNYANLRTVTGSFELIATSGYGISASGGTCQGTGGYSDIGPGSSVILKDETGTVIGSTFLGTGTGTSTDCTFTFSMPNVPDTAKFYVITVSHRGDISKSHAELAANGWAFYLTMGS